MQNSAMRLEMADRHPLQGAWKVCAGYKPGTATTTSCDALLVLSRRLTDALGWRLQDGERAGVQIAEGIWMFASHTCLWLIRGPTRRSSPTARLHGSVP